MGELNRLDELREIDGLLDQVLEMAPEARTRFFADIRLKDPEKGAKLEALWKTSEQVSDFMEDPAEIPTMALAEGEQADPSPVEPDMTGQQLGNYRIVSELGRGGMGRVFLAERADGQFDRQVALKLVRLDFDEQTFMARFHQERRILSQLQHPNIAQLLDSGVSDGGMPFFVMEYVQGEPITQYCDRKKLDIAARLKLFLEVCDAVAFAHGRLVIHRDLKANNILVSAEGAVKLLDFGIAKVLEPQAFGLNSELTQTHQRFLTPECASPEQVLGEAVTTASDIYGLGCLLYKLLTGFLPFDSEETGAAALWHSICHRDPERPSKKISRTVKNEETTKKAVDIAFKRRSSPPRLAQTMSGDLDAIILKCLRKEPNQRFASAGLLADDIQNYLQGHPVKARAGSRRYRARKFISRHRYGLAALCGVLIMALVFAGMLAANAVRIKQERDRAQFEAQKSQQVVAFLRDLFEVSDPFGGAAGEDLTVRDLLQRGVTRIDRELAHQPEIKAELLALMGKSLESLSALDEAENLYGDILSIRESQTGVQSLAYGLALRNLGWIDFLRGKPSKALEIYLQVQEILKSHLPPDHPQWGKTLRDVARIYHRLGKYQPAVEHVQAAINVLNGQEPSPDLDLGEAHLALAQFHGAVFDSAKAVPEARKALSFMSAAVGENHPHYAKALNTLGIELNSLEGPAAARPYLERSLAIVEDKLGPESLAVASILINVALMERDAGNSQKDYQLRQRVLAIEEARLGRDNMRVAKTLNNLGSTARELRELQDARRFLLESVAIMKRHVPADNYWLSFPYMNLALTHLDLGELDQALLRIKETISIREKRLQAGNPILGNLYLIHGKILAAMGSPEQAEAEMRRAVKIFSEADPPEYGSLPWGQLELGVFLNNHDMSKEALEVLEQALEAVEELDPVDKKVLFEHLVLACDALSLAEKKARYHGKRTA